MVAAQIWYPARLAWLHKVQYHSRHIQLSRAVDTCDNYDKLDHEPAPSAQSICVDRDGLFTIYTIFLVRTSSMREMETYFGVKSEVGVLHSILMLFHLQTAGRFVV